MSIKIYATHTHVQTYNNYNTFVTKIHIKRYCYCRKEHTSQYVLIFGDCSTELPENECCRVC